MIKNELLLCGNVWAERVKFALNIFYSVTKNLNVCILGAFAGNRW